MQVFLVLADIGVTMLQLVFFRGVLALTGIAFGFAQLATVAISLPYIFI
jgi:hypothetical protein